MEGGRNIVMKIKDFKATENRVTRIRKIKKEKETDAFINKKDYYLEQIDEKTWRYYWFKK